MKTSQAMDCPELHPNPSQLEPMGLFYALHPIADESSLPFFCRELFLNMSQEECLASLLTQKIENPSANAGDTGSIPGSGRSPGGGHGNPLQYSCLENPMDRGA